MAEFLVVRRPEGVDEGGDVLIPRRAGAGDDGAGQGGVLEGEEHLALIVLVEDVADKIHVFDRDVGAVVLGAVGDLDVRGHVVVADDGLDRDAVRGVDGAVVEGHVDILAADAERGAVEVVQEVIRRAEAHIVLVVVYVEGVDERLAGADVDHAHGVKDRVGGVEDADDLRAGHIGLHRDRVLAAADVAPAAAEDRVDAAVAKLREGLGRGVLRRAGVGAAGGAEDGAVLGGGGVGAVEVRAVLLPGGEAEGVHAVAADRVQAVVADDVDVRAVAAVQRVDAPVAGIQLAVVDVGAARGLDEQRAGACVHHDDAGGGGIAALGAHAGDDGVADDGLLHGGGGVDGAAAVAGGVDVGVVHGESADSGVHARALGALPGVLVITGLSGNQGVFLVAVVRAEEDDGVVADAVHLVHVLRAADGEAALLVVEHEAEVTEDGRAVPVAYAVVARVHAGDAFRRDSAAADGHLVGGKSAVDHRDRGGDGHVLRVLRKGACGRGGHAAGRLAGGQRRRAEGEQHDKRRHEREKLCGFLHAFDSFPVLISKTRASALGERTPV